MDVRVNSRTTLTSFKEVMDTLRNVSDLTFRMLMQRIFRVEKASLKGRAIEIGSDFKIILNDGNYDEDIGGDVLTINKLYALLAIAGRSRRLNPPVLSHLCESLCTDLISEEDQDLWTYIHFGVFLCWKGGDTRERIMVLIASVTLDYLMFTFRNLKKKQFGNLLEFLQSDEFRETGNHRSWDDLCRSNTKMDVQKFRAENQKVLSRLASGIRFRFKGTDEKAFEPLP